MKTGHSGVIAKEETFEKMLVGDALLSCKLIFSKIVTNIENMSTQHRFVLLYFCNMERVNLLREKRI